MNLKKYINEILVFIALLLMVGAYMYKTHQIDQQAKNVTEVKRSLSELKEVIALKKIWGEKVSKKVDSLKSVISPSKVKWTKKQTKITASYTNLNSTELNKLVTKIANTPVIITLLDVSTSASNYNVEFKCKW